MHPLFQNLLQHFNQFTPISNEEFGKMSSYFAFQELKRKESISTFYEKCQYNHFVLNGCLHMFFIDEKGTERTVQFAIENWWITDNLAFLHQQQTEFSIQATEASSILSISFEKQEKLLDEFPKLEKYFRHVYQTAYGAAMNRLKYIFGSSKEESYFRFIENHPHFAQRVPQYLIASFLGLTPEYVSEIRAKHTS